VLLRSPQDAELLLLAASSGDDLRERIDAVHRIAGELSLAELGDLAVTLHRELPRDRFARAAVVASTPGELAGKLECLRDELGALERSDIGEPPLDQARGAFLGLGWPAPRIGLLFPGQGSPTVLDGGALGRRFEWFAHVAGVAGNPRPRDADTDTDTAVAQPAIVACSLGGLALLRAIGVCGDVAVGHSVGELTALHWAGAMSDVDVRTLAAARGRAMAQLGDADGAMASIAAEAELVRRLLAEDVVCACFNGPRQTVVAGPVAAVARLMDRAVRAGAGATRLPVSHAFHSPLVAAAASPLAAALDELRLSSLDGALYSTITGNRLAADADVRQLLLEQLTHPVHFAGALSAAQHDVELFVEVGPGTVLQGLARQITSLPVLALDAGGSSLRPPLSAAGALFACGAATTLAPLFEGRFTRPFALERRRAFLANPCEQAPRDDGRPVAAKAPRTATSSQPRAADMAADAAAPLAIVRRLVAARTELPEATIDDDSRLLADLHLTSIVVGELAAEAARAIGFAPPAPPTEMSTATVAQLAAAIEAAGSDDAAAVAVPDGVAAWVRPFAVEFRRRERAPAQPAPVCRWTVHVADGHPLRDAIAAAFVGDRGEPAILVCLPPEPQDSHAELLLRAAAPADRYAFLQHGGGAAGFARSLALERPGAHVCVIDVPPDATLLAQVRAEAEAATGFAEIRYDADGIGRVPVLVPADPRPGPELLGGEDVLLVSGGGKGIAAECALQLAGASGAAAILVGRSQPAQDPELAENLARYADAGVRHRYVSADVTDGDAVRLAVERVARELGPVTAILHGAGVNVPARLDDLDVAEMERTLAPKLLGAQSLLAAVDRSRLRLLVTFGSIIGRLGLRGEAHYALANDRLAQFVERIDEQLPDCRCLNVEWSVWSGAGMGERLGTVAALAQLGVSPIPVEQGVRWLAELVRCADLPPSLVVAGRFGDPPTVDLEPRPLPLRRFLERPRVHYPGVELVVDAELTRGTDPYLDDHVLDGSALLPAVFGLEAMASAAQALTGDATRPVITGARFERPVTVPRDGSRHVRVACLRRRDGAVDVVLRSDETGFQVEHFQATFRFGEPLELGGAPPVGAAGVGLDPADVYGRLLFHGPLFQRVRGFRELSARSCVAEVDIRDCAWFGAFLPQDLVLGDPGARDAAIHAVQACIPHERLVPVGVERIAGTGLECGVVLARATERYRDGDTFVYDIVLHDEHGRVRERWDGLALQRIGSLDLPGRWPPALLSPYLERRLEELVDDGPTRIEMLHGEGPRRANADLAMSRALCSEAIIRRRADGRPTAQGAGDVGAAHLDGWTLAVGGRGTVACDIELAASRPPHVWRDLLGEERLELARRLAVEGHEGLDRAATRVWSAAECVKKAGMSVGEPLKLLRTAPDGWTILRCDRTRVATLATRISDIDGDVVVAVLAGGERR
jgi:enediyne polyketide synthase